MGIMFTELHSSVVQTSAWLSFLHAYLFQLVSSGYIHTQNRASGLVATPEAVILINQFSLAPKQSLNGEDSATGIIEKFPRGYFIL